MVIKQAMDSGEATGSSGEQLPHCLFGPVKVCLATPLLFNRYHQLPAAGSEWHIEFSSYALALR